MPCGWGAAVGGIWESFSRLCVCLWCRYMLRGLLVRLGGFGGCLVADYHRNRPNSVPCQYRGGVRTPTKRRQTQTDLSQRLFGAARQTPLKSIVRWDICTGNTRRMRGEARVTRRARDGTRQFAGPRKQPERETRAASKTRGAVCSCEYTHARHAEVTRVRA